MRPTRPRPWWGPRPPLWPPSGWQSAAHFTSFFFFLSKLYECVFKSQWRAAAVKILDVCVWKPASNGWHCHPPPCARTPLPFIPGGPTQQVGWVWLTDMRLSHLGFSHLRNNSGRILQILCVFKMVVDTIVFTWNRTTRCNYSVRCWNQSLKSTICH